MELQRFDKKQILDNVKKDESGRFSLNDLYEFSQKKKNTDPRTWLRQENVQDLITAVSGVLNVSLNHIINSKRGKGGGTYAHRNIFLAYAKYLDAELHVIANEIVFERIAEEKNPDLILDRAVSTYQRKGKSVEWINKRLNAKGVRLGFTEVLKKHGVIGSDGYRTCTNAMYIALYGKTASEIREIKQLPKKANLRENMSELELQAISFAESLAKQDITDNRRYGNEECAISSNLAARVVSNSIKQFKNNR